MTTRGNAHPAARGALLALIAAVLFGASTPLVQAIGVNVGGWMTAALLYAGATAAGLLLRSHSAREAPLERRHWARLMLVSGFGAVLAPALLAWGLQHTGGLGASLMLSLEAVFTVLLAYLVFGERIDRRVGLAVVLMTGGGLLLVFDRAERGPTETIGLLAVLAATVCWALDNTLSRPLAQLDPGRVVLAKSVLGSGASVLIAGAIGAWVVTRPAALGLFLVGALGYGLSLRFYLLAQRAFGAARTGSVFAAAPFIGAMLAFALGDRGLSIGMLGGTALMLIGVLLHILERHEHEHQHDFLEHEHAHTHDDGHHAHGHQPMPDGSHSHWHSHAPLRHRHPHTPDCHHAHPH